MGVRYSYLPQQFADIDGLLLEVKALVQSGDFTMGAALTRFEHSFAALIGTTHAVGVGSGTDALKLSLRVLGVGPGDEVVTAANTFIATVGAINEIGARPVFVDCDDSFCMNVDLVDAAVSSRTKAIMPVHYTGNMTDMPALLGVAEARGLPIVEDACQAILADIDGRRAGTWGIAAGFSLHPLKNLNVWGDGGVIVTDDDGLADELRLLRNHGMVNRDEVAMFGYNSRLDTLHAVVGNWLIPSAESITQGRIEHARQYDAELGQVEGIRIPPRSKHGRHVFHLYMVFAEDRDGLLAHCHQRGIEAKVHYPIPLYQQAGLAQLGYAAGDFPVTDRHARSVITFPCDQHLSQEQHQQVVSAVKEFYQG